MGRLASIIVWQELEFCQPNPFLASLPLLFSFLYLSVAVLTILHCYTSRISRFLMCKPSTDSFSTVSVETENAMNTSRICKPGKLINDSDTLRALWTSQTWEKKLRRSLQNNTQPQTLRSRLDNVAGHCT